MPTVVLSNETLLAALESQEELTASSIATRCDDVISVEAVRKRLATLKRRGLVERRQARADEVFGNAILPWLWRLTPAGRKLKKGVGQ